MRVVSKRSRDILQQAKGITLIKSTQIRWFSRWSGRGGWSGRAKLSGGQESQTKAKGLSGCQQPKQPDGGLEGQIKNYSYDKLLKETELKAALNWSTRRGKGSPPKKAPWLKKEKTLTLGFKLAVVEGGGVDGDEVADEWEPGVPITSPCDSVTISDFGARKARDI
jgi:hypothetical protein